MIFPDIFDKTYGINLEKYGIYLPKSMGYIRIRLQIILWDICGKNYVIYCKKIMGYTMGYIFKKLWVIFDKT